jgi:hypothetical protein
VAITGSPFSVTAAPFTTLTVPQASLSTSSTYYARVRYATTLTAPATSDYSAWSSFATASAFLPAPGIAFGGGFFGGQISDGGIVYNLIVGPRDTAQNGGNTPAAIQWKNAATAESAANTAAAQNVAYGFPMSQIGFSDGATTYPALHFARSVSTGGFNDWYLPARNELEILYYNLKPTTAPPDNNSTTSGINPNAVPARSSNYTSSVPGQTASTLFRSTGAQAFSTLNSYWTSTEFSGGATQALVDSFSIGSQAPDGKLGTYYARAIRREYANAPVAIGAAFGGGFFAGQYVDGGITYNLIVAPKATGEYGPGVGTIQYNIANAADTNPNSQNTVYGKLASDQFNDANHPAFQWARGLSIGTFNDWYIPAYDEMNIITLNLGPIWTTAPNFKSGTGAEALSTTPNYWSASEVPSNTARAWAFRMDDVSVIDTNKSTGLSARAVRRVPA